MGRNEAGSLGSSLCFFSSGQTIAFLLRSGSFTRLNDALHMRAVTGARTSPTCLISQVGAASSGHCFESDRFKMDGRHFVGSRRSQVDQRLRDKAVDNIMLGGGDVSLR